MKVVQRDGRIEEVLDDLHRRIAERATGLEVDLQSCADTGLLPPGVLAFTAARGSCVWSSLDQLEPAFSPPGGPLPAASRPAARALMARAAAQARAARGGSAARHMSSASSSAFSHSAAGEVGGVAFVEGLVDVACYRADDRAMLSLPVVALARAEAKRDELVTVLVVRGTALQRALGTVHAIVGLCGAALFG